MLNLIFITIQINLILNKKKKNYIYIYIGEELDRVSNRLANKNAQQQQQDQQDQHQTTEFKVPAIPPPVFQKQQDQQSQFTKTLSASSKVPETLPAMDETISSINTTASVVADLKTQKSYQANKQLLNTSGHNHHSNPTSQCHNQIPK